MCHQDQIRYARWLLAACDQKIEVPACTMYALWRGVLTLGINGLSQIQVF